MKKHAGTLDFILDCVSADHDIAAYLNLLKHDGNLTLVSAPREAAVGLRVRGSCSAAGASPDRSSAASPRRRRCSTSAASTTSPPTLKVIAIQKINEAYERLLKGDVKYRFSIDTASLKAE